GPPPKPSFPGGPGDQGGGFGGFGGFGGGLDDPGGNAASYDSFGVAYDCTAAPSYRDDAAFADQIRQNGLTPPAPPAQPAEPGNNWVNEEPDWNSFPPPTTPPPTPEDDGGPC
ncbi:MAG: hypothetical protein K2X81_15330, partial [Candidatus Obscuribacterales bacterium]|nr:hypothetical protein [Candidatus Obscuribacterales bacterium]